METHRVFHGRRWRVSDPRIPEPLRQALVDELMAARRAVKHAGEDDAAVRAARARVHAAKVALGERGVAWWLDDPPPEGVAERIRLTARALAGPGDAAVDAGSVAAVTSQPVELVRQVLSRPDDPRGGAAR